MARDSSTLRDACPFWSMQAMKCQLFREGLFIPLNDHIEVYCKTHHYSQCLQFSLHAQNYWQPVEKNREDRRKYQRVPACHRVTLVEPLQTGLLASHVSTAHGLPAKCTTLDLSKGGMRLATEQPLAKATAILFSFEQSFPESVQTGEGQIAWCKAWKGFPKYQMGISFQSDRLIDTMGLYLGLITSTPPSTA